MKKIFSLMIAVAFVFGTIGCDDKPKSTGTTKKEETKKTEETKDGKKTTEETKKTEEKK